jgi:hypothetical protein
MRASFPRLLIGMVATILLAFVAGQLVASAADSQPAASLAFGGVLLGAWLGFMAASRMTFTNDRGDVFRFHPQYVAGVSVVIVACALLLAGAFGLAVLAFVGGVLLILFGRRRSEFTSAS